MVVYVELEQDEWPTAQEFVARMGRGSLPDTLYLTTQNRLRNPKMVHRVGE
jgi:hypothetical protein